VAGWISVQSWPGRELVKEIQSRERGRDRAVVARCATIAATLRDGRIALWSVQDGRVAYLKGEHKESAVGLAVDARRNHSFRPTPWGDLAVDIASLQKIGALPAQRRGAAPSRSAMTLAMR